MARKKTGNKPRQVMGRDFAQQSESAASFAPQSERATAALSGNTGEGQLAPAYRARKATKGARGGSTNFARRKRSQRVANALGNKQAPADAAQRPMIADRQYQMAPAMTR